MPYSLHCLRCNRSLSDPKSIERGYGSHCWTLIESDDKRNEQELLEYIKGERETNEYPSLSFYIHDVLDLACPHCGEFLKQGNPEHYEHTGGEKLNGYKNPQWIFIKCAKCHYEWSLWKLKNRIERSKLQEEVVSKKCV